MKIRIAWTPIRLGSQRLENVRKNLDTSKPADRVNPDISYITNCQKQTAAVCKGPLPHDSVGQSVCQIANPMNLKTDQSLTNVNSEPCLPWTGERLIPSLFGQIATEHLHRYAIARALATGKDVLDIASGEGYGSALLAQVAHSVTGVDCSSQAVEHSKLKYRKPNLRFLQGNCINIPVANASMDLVVSYETIEHITQQEIFLDEVRRVLRPGGTFIVSTPDVVGYNDGKDIPNPFHLRELSRTEFLRLLHSCFANVASYGQRYFPGSVILPNHRTATTNLEYFHGDYEEIGCFSELRNPVYIIAVCSDSEIPVINPGFFELRAPVESSVPPDPEKTRLSIALDQSQEKVRHLEEVSRELKKAVDSALRWQQRSSFTRAFHHWRVPGENKKMGSLHKLGQSIRKRCKLMSDFLLNRP